MGRQTNFHINLMRKCTCVFDNVAYALFHCSIVNSGIVCSRTLVHVYTESPEYKGILHVPVYRLTNYTAQM